MKVDFRTDFTGVVHVVSTIGYRENGEWSHWKPLCRLDLRWKIVEGSASPGPVTCLSCLTWGISK